MTLDNNGDIWTADNQGLTHYTNSSATEHRYNEETKRSSIKSTDYPFRSTADATVNVLFQGKDGTFWIGGSADASILLLNFDPDSDSKFIPIRTIITNNSTDESIDPPQHLPVLASTDGTFAIHDIAQQGPYGVEHLWFAGRNLLLRFDGEKLHQILPDRQNMDQTDGQTGNPDDTVLHHNRFHNEIWLSDEGRIRWSDGNRLRKLYADNSSEFFGILKMQDTLGSLWFVSPTGVHQYNQVSGINKTYTIEDGLGSENIRTVFEAADGKIWFGHDNGATVFNPRSAFVNFKTRPTLGSNSVHQIYEIQDELWFSIPGGIANYRQDLLSQQKLHPAYVESKVEPKTDTSPTPTESDSIVYVESRVEPKTDTSPTPTESDPKLAEGKNRRTEIAKIFRNRQMQTIDTWLINRANQTLTETETETLYTFFPGAPRFAGDILRWRQLSIRVQTEKGRVHHPEVLVSSPENPFIAFGGWLFRPDSDGLKWLSPQGTRTFAFQDSPPFEDLPKIEHGPSAIVDIHTDKQGRIWCYLEDGTVQLYANLNILEDMPKLVLPEVIQITHIKPLRLPNPKTKSDRSAENAAPKWFFKSQTKEILYWDIENTGALTPVQGNFTVPPIAIWESADEREVTFIFSNRLKKYLDTVLVDEKNVNVAEVRAALLTNARVRDARVPDKRARVLWLATKQGAIRYDGTTFETYGIEDGFLVNDLRDVHEDTWGHIWFATWGGGAIRYDGETFTPVTTKDGLAHNSISDIHQSRDGYIWFATEGGVTRYLPSDGALPFCKITAINDKPYKRIPETPLAFPSQTNNIAFHFKGSNPLQLRHHLTYEFKLLGLGTNDWTRGSAQQDEVTQTFAINTATDEDPSVTYQGLKPGKYTFLVKTYRKGWPYTSAPAAVNFTIDSPFWAQWRSYLPYLILIGLLITIVPYLLARLLVNRRQVARLHAEMQEKEEAEMQQLRAELDEARNMQEALLPTEVPEVEGLDVAGMSLPATQVGGDFYDYLNAGEKHLAIAVADAAGKGLRGALNAVLTNGMLNEIVQIQYSADVILTNLNASLVPRLYGRTFIALNLAIIDTEDKRIFYANAGQPYPILKRGDTLIEIEASELPLGGMKRTEYGQEQLELAPGDIYIFYTDGVIEALNSEEEMYGTERLKSVFAEAPQHLSAEEIIQHIFKDIQAFVQTAEQYDDITIVVVRHQPTTQ